MSTESLRISSPAPDFHNLPATDGEMYSLQDFGEAEVLVVVFSCNHCPYVRAYEDRMVSLQREYTSLGVRLVAINSNETEHYPDDDFNGMVARSKEKQFNFTYIRDEDQSVATAYGATHTPEFFVFDKQRKLRYHGKFDDNYQNPSVVKSKYVRDAIDAIIAGKEVPQAETFSIGCTIKWKS